MAFRRFIISHRYIDEDGRVIVIPSGWAGELPGIVAAAADEAGATVRPEEPPEPKAKGKS
ncbi:hypothetical protein PY32053_00775 [Paracoccus yeei]|uniref:Uncharacterized protein n=1 Tax=Paracoccus yeei TaxID=147645 RepID=A0A386UJW8_9RHOB|nr:hypothetical protein PY32053_00775 [Paracoccus yeei]